MGRREYQEARRVGEEALSPAREFGRRPLEAGALQATCDLELAVGNLEEARFLATKVLALQRAMGTKRHDATTWWTLASIARIEGDLDAAEEMVLPTHERARATPTPLHVAWALTHLVEVERFRGNVEAARERFTEAAEAHGATAHAVECLLRRARVEVEGGLLEAARATLDEMLHLKGEQEGPDVPSTYDVWGVIAGHCERDLDGVPEQVQLYEAADLHLALHVAGHRGDHLEQALRTLEHLSRHLRGEALDRFWRWNVTARRARAMW